MPVLQVAVGSREVTPGVLVCTVMTFPSISLPTKMLLASS